MEKKKLFVGEDQWGGCEVRLRGVERMKKENMKGELAGSEGKRKGDDGEEATVHIEEDLPTKGRRLWEVERSEGMALQEGDS